MSPDNRIEILLIEDSPEDAEMTLRAFKNNNLTNKILVIDDGAEALEYIFSEIVGKDGELSHSPKLILLDLKLPKVSGLEILKRLKGDERTKTIPVVVMTSSEQEQDMVESYKLGVNSYLVKPVDFKKFTEAVGQLGLYWMLLNKFPG